MTSQQRNRARRICIEIEVDRRAMHRLLADMERRAKELPWWKRIVALWVLRLIVPHWCGYKLGEPSIQPTTLNWLAAKRIFG